MTDAALAPGGAGDESVRVVAWQLTPGRFPTDAEQAALADLRPDLVVLPEYAAVAPMLGTPLRSFVDFDRNLDRLRWLAVRLNCVVVGGTVVEKESQDYFNTCFVFDRRIHVGFYRKVHVTAKERAAGISPGSGHRIVTAGRLRIGLLVCADVLQPSAFDAMVGADVVAVPTSSPYLPEDTPETKERRDQEIFVEGARRCGAYVVKCCAAKSLLGARLQGRSLVASPDGIVARVPWDQESEEARLVVDLPLAGHRAERSA